MLGFGWGSGSGSMRILITNFSFRDYFWRLFFAGLHCDAHSLECQIVLLLFSFVKGGRYRESFNES